MAVLFTVTEMEEQQSENLINISFMNGVGSVHVEGKSIYWWVE